MQLSEPRFIYPPRPAKTPIPRDQLDMFARRKWICQLKYDDKRAPISVNGDEILIYNRRSQLRRDYQAPDWMLDEIREAAKIFGLNPEQWSYLDGGLLHHKHKSLHDLLVVWDIIVRDGEYLLDSNCIDRYNSLRNKLRGDRFMVDVGGTEFEFGVKVTDHIFMPTLWANYEEAWEFVEKVNKAGGWTGDGEPVLEGVILKAPNGKLQLAAKEENNNDWSVRSRVRTGRHRF